MRLRRHRVSRRDRATAEAALDWTRTLWDAKLWRGNEWLGVPILQWPTDLHVLQEILFRERPRAIVETGTNRGGSAVFFSSILSLVHGPDAPYRVITVDVNMPPEVRETLANHPHGGERIVAIEGDAKASPTVESVVAALGGEDEVLVFLDSDHSKEHVLGEMRAYAPLVRPGGWMIVFDTICKWLADLPSAPSEWAEDNPWHAVEAFLRESDEFSRDSAPEKLLVTFGAGGFLRRSGGRDASLERPIP